jgi:hypothetical protein
MGARMQGVYRLLGALFTFVIPVISLVFGLVFFVSVLFHVVDTVAQIITGPARRRR